MLGRGVTEGWKLHNLFYPPVRKQKKIECKMKEREE